MKKPKTIQDPSRWTQASEDRYIIEACENYLRRAGDPLAKPGWRFELFQDRRDWVPPHKVREAIIVEYYDRGRLLGLLKCDFNKFRHEILGLRTKRRVKLGHAKRNWRTGEVTLKPSSKFQKSEHTSEKPKKTADQENREAWRKRKGFNRRRSAWSRSCPKSIKRECAKARRGYGRNMIYRQDWDNALTETRRDFVDPWMWD